MENLYEPNCIRTASGIYVNVFEPTLDMINIEDIAHSLSHQCRFAGHLPRFYSVAQHSVSCASIVEDKYKLQALLHDASEAYLLDIPSPIKRGLTNYKELEHNIMTLIAEKFGFNYPLDEVVKRADHEMLVFEWNHIMLKQPTQMRISFLSPESIKVKFLELFEELVKVTTY